MVKFHSISQDADDTSGAVLSIILLSTSVLSLVIAIMGIKWWWRQKLSLEDAENRVESPVLLRTTSVTEVRENCARGVYRQSVDSESLVVEKSPSVQPTNGTAKAKNNDRQSIFKLPFRSKLKLPRFSRGENNEIMTSQQSLSPSVHPPNKQQDLATIQKNQNLRRKIHDTLFARSSASMPDLSRSPVLYRERSVDEHPEDMKHNNQPINIPTVEFYDEIFSVKNDYENSLSFEPDDTIDIYAQPKKVNITNDKNIEVEIVQKRVQFEEIREIEKIEYYEARFEEEIEDEFGEVTTRRLAFRSYSADDESDDKKVEVIPPMPMKRKSRENSFEAPNVDSNEISNTELTKARPSPVKPRIRRGVHRTGNASKIETSDDEIKTVEEAKEPPKVIHRTVDFDEIKSSEDDKKILKEVKETAEVMASNEDISEKLVVHVEISEVPSKFEEVLIVENLKLIDDVTSDSESINKEKIIEEALKETTLIKEVAERSEAFEPHVIEFVEKHAMYSQPIEIHTVPKSILKSSDTSDFTSSPKTITFQNDPHTITDSETSSSDSEEDIWSKVEDHRLVINRQKIIFPEGSPPPMPKTPPPSADPDVEEKLFNYDVSR